jgi:hypothetical protein
MDILERLKVPELTRRTIVIICVFTVFFLYGLISFVGSLKENVVAAEKRIFASVKVGIGRYSLESFSKGRSPVYPPVLDEAQNGFAGEKNPFFTNVLAYPGVVEPSWRKLLPEVYQGPGKSLYFYDKDSGDFLQKMLLEPYIERVLGIPATKITGQLISRLRSQAVVAFSDGNQLIGGAVLLIPRLNGEFVLKGEESPERKFSLLSGEMDAEIAVKAPSLKSPIKFGYYTFEAGTNQVVLNEIFSGQEVPSVRSTFIVPPGKSIGFYFSLPGEIQELYFSEKQYNQDKLEHVRFFENQALRKISIAFDRSRHGERAFQDMIVAISY